MDSDEIEFFSHKRQYMLEEHLQRRNIRDERVLQAMGEIPRQLFVPQQHREHAYADAPLPIGVGQTISQPYIVAYMTQALNLHGDEKVLEIGTGSGYQAAILTRLAAQVYSIERHASLAAKARQTLADLEIHNIEIFVGDGTLGYPLQAPYQAIMVTAAAPEVPQPLLDQLAEGGRLILPVGERGNQWLQLWTRKSGFLEKLTLVPVAFVLLRGEHGWQDEL